MHSVKRILTTENQTCEIRPTAIQSEPHIINCSSVFIPEQLHSSIV